MKSRTRLSDFTFTFHFHALEKEMATHSGVLAWRIPGTGETGGLPSMGWHRVGHDWSNLAAAASRTRVRVDNIYWVSMENLASCWHLTYTIWFNGALNNRMEKAGDANSWDWFNSPWSGLSWFSPVPLFVTLWTVACQTPMSMWSLQARILEWVGKLSSRILEVESESRSVVSDSLWFHGLYSPWNSPGQNTGMGSCSLLQGIFPT